MDDFFRHLLGFAAVALFIVASARGSRTTAVLASLGAVGAVGLEAGLLGFSAVGWAIVGVHAPLAIAIHEVTSPVRSRRREARRIALGALASAGLFAIVLALASQGTGAPDSARTPSPPEVRERLGGETRESSVDDGSLAGRELVLATLVAWGIFAAGLALRRRPAFQSEISYGESDER